MIKQISINIKYIGHLKGHSDCVTSISIDNSQNKNEESNRLITASRDGIIIIWQLNTSSEDPSNFAQSTMQLTGHTNSISDLALTSDNNYLLSSSWDRTLRIWKLSSGQTFQQFIEEGHTSEVLSCCISNDSRYILSASADCSIKLWNSLGACKLTVKKHEGSVSKVRFIPRKTGSNEYFASVDFNGYLNIWDTQTFDIKNSIKIHDGPINALAVSTKGDFIATGGNDKKIHVFGFNSIEKPAFSHYSDTSVNCLAFNPHNHWIAIGTETGWQIWDFEANYVSIIGEGSFKLEGNKLHQVTSIIWNNRGNGLFIGLRNGDIKVMEVTEKKQN